MEGRLVVASNATLYCTIRRGDAEAACVYKPVAGERPLWDFPHGTLAGREVAAYAVSRAAGWNLVPPTVYRDGPFGPGMCQLWIDTDAAADLVALSRSADNRALRDMAVFDAVVNNADRKIGHLLPVSDGRAVRLRPRGLLRRGVQAAHRALAVARPEAARPGRLQALARLKAELATGSLAAELPQRLTEDEITATRQRVDLLLQAGVHPYPPEDWPAVPGRPYQERPGSPG